MKGIVILLLTVSLVACAGNTEFVKSDSPRERFVTLQGTVDSKLDYVFAVYYETRSEQKQCKHFTYPLGWLPAGKAFLYRPMPVNGSYKVTLPLRELRTDTDCHWNVKWVNLCAMPKGGSDEDRNCTILFYLYNRSGFTALADRSTVACRRKDHFCRSPELAPSKQWYLATENRAYTVDISSQ